MDTMEENQDSPALDPKLAPALLFERPRHGGADEAGDGEETTDDGTMFLYSIPKRRLLVVTGLDYLNGDATWITPQGWVLVVDPSTREASLRDPFTSRTVRLPPDHHESGGLLPSSYQDTRCLLSTTHRPDDDDDPAAAGCIIVLVVHLEDPVLWYCSPGGSRWFRHEYPSELIESDHNSIRNAMSRLTAARGKFYTYVNVAGEHNKILALEFSPGPVFSSTQVARTPFVSRFLQMRAVESCGDLFFLLICLEPLCAQGITEIHVYKLVISSNNDARVMVMVKQVATLGDNRVFFSGSCSRCGDSYEFGASMAADEVGLKPNCIYFTHGDDKGLYVHDLERGTTTLHNPATNIPDSVRPVLLMRAVL